MNESGSTAAGEPGVKGERPGKRKARPRRRLPGRLIAAWALVLAGAVGCLLVRDSFTLPVWFALCGATLFTTSKAAMLLRLDDGARRRLSWAGRLAFLAWPGMRVEPFLHQATPPRPTPGPSLWATGAVNLTAGAVLLWAAPAWLPLSTPWLVRIGMGIVGYTLFFLFGVTDWWAALYRRCGVPVEKLWDNPAAAASLADFWGNRWNRIFIGFARDLLFNPLARVVGARAASFVVFLFSGLLHEWAWSAAVRGGYGGPMLYFLLQGLFVQAESTAVGRSLFRKAPLVGRVWTALCVLSPLPLLLNQAILDGVVIPQLVALGVARPG